MSDKIIFETPIAFVDERVLLSIIRNSDGEVIEKANLKNIARTANTVSLASNNSKNVVATMSYKKIGQKLAKNISFVNGLNFFFKYDKDSGYFDRPSDLLSKNGNEYSISDMTIKKFYTELIEVLKLRLALGYMEYSDKTKSADYYFRHAHKYILVEKYNLRPEECMNFVRGVVAKSYIPEKFTEGFLKELRKSFYETELSKSEMLEVETFARISLMNEKKAKFSVDDINLHTQVLNEIRKNDSPRQINIMKLREAMNEYQ